MGPGAGLPRAPPPAPRWAERAPGPRLNAKAGGDGAGFQPRPPNRPNQSSRGPPCGHFQEQPRTWCTSPTPGAATRDPPTPPDRSQTQRHSRGDQQSPILSPRNLSISVKQEDSWPLQARPGGQPSFPRCLPKVPSEPLCGSLHSEDTTSSFLLNVSKPCDCLAKFLSYRTMEPSVFCQESEQGCNATGDF